MTYLKTAMLKPTRKYKLDISKYPKAMIVTDASQLGRGALLLVNNRAIRALSFQVTETHISSDSQIATSNRARKASSRPWQSWRVSRHG